jgi:hypothetical protein
MKFQLQISERSSRKDYFSDRRFSFAVIDLDKAEWYPLNFVCMLPMNLSADGAVESIFERVYGDKCFEVAKKLLLESLEQEHDSKVRGEIERRLKLLELKPDIEKRCLACGKLFQVQPAKRFKQKYCPECVKKKFGNRE